uniref:Uncharacterized protein n=1 Tax=Globodera rostochiensis TaxID=31243 RepID=A0A914HBN1_GLORO
MEQIHQQQFKQFNKLIIGFWNKFIKLYSNDSESNNDNNKITCNQWNCINKFINANKFKQFNELVIGFWNKFILIIGFWNKFILIIGFWNKFINPYSNDSESNNDNNKTTCNQWNCINKFINPNKFEQFSELFEQFSELVIGFWNQFINNKFEQFNKLIICFWNKFINPYSNDSESNNDNNKTTCNQWNCINKFINPNKFKQFNELVIGFWNKFILIIGFWNQFINNKFKQFNKLIIGFWNKFINPYSNDSESNNDNNKTTCNQWNCINKFINANKFKQFNKLVIGFWNKFILIVGFWNKFILIIGFWNKFINPNKFKQFNELVIGFWNKFILIIGFWNKFINPYGNDSESNNDNNKATCNQWNCINKFINPNKFEQFNELIIGFSANERHYDGETGKCHFAVSTSNGPNKLQFGQQLEGQSGRRCDSLCWGGGKCERQFVRLKFFKFHDANFCRFNDHNDDEAADDSQWHFCANKFNRSSTGNSSIGMAGGSATSTMGSGGILTSTRPNGNFPLGAFPLFKNGTSAFEQLMNRTNITAISRRR